MFGSHLSIAGGLHNALIEAHRLGMEVAQIFTKNQQQWVGKPLTPEIISTFKDHAQKLNFKTIVAHDSYLINLAAQDEAKWKQAKDAFSEEMRRCDQLGVQFLVTHPGAHLGTGEEAGIARVIAAYNEILRDHPNDGVTVCLETTAGQGSTLGHRFEHLAAMLAGIERKDRFAICLDTAHILAAGYDITTEASTQKVFEEFDRIIGLQNLKVFHLNDSKKALGTRVDRHDHLGRGHVGLAAFKFICTNTRFASIPKILETPKDSPTKFAEDGREWDTLNLEILRHLTAGKPVKPQPSHVEAPKTKQPQSASKKPIKALSRRSKTQS